MKLNKNDILETLKKYNLDPKEYIVISGAALVLQDIKEYTSDIDIAVSGKLYNKLLKEYNCTFEKRVKNYDVWFIDNVLNFSKNYYKKTEYTELFDYKIQTINSVLKLKKNLNRLKDQEDAQFILNYYKTKGKIE